MPSPTSGFARCSGGRSAGIRNMADVSIVVESFTHGEGSSLERVSIALDAATRMVEELGDGEVLVADASADPALVELVRRRFPRTRVVEAAGLGYDEAKMKA